MGSAGEERHVTVDYRVAPSVLEAIVRGSLAEEPKLRAPHGVSRGARHPVDVDVQEGACSVSVHVLAPLGEDLVALGSMARATIARRLSTMTGMPVARIDLHVEGVYAVDTPQS